MYDRTYGTLEPGIPGVISFVAQLALENIATSDAPYHDVNHTIMVTLVGQEILRGRHISVGGVSACYRNSASEQAVNRLARPSGLADRRGNDPELAPNRFKSLFRD